MGEMRPLGSLSIRGGAGFEPSSVGHQGPESHTPRRGQTGLVGVPRADDSPVGISGHLPVKQPWSMVPEALTWDPDILETTPTTVFGNIPSKVHLGAHNRKSWPRKRISFHYMRTENRGWKQAYFFMIILAPSVSTMFFWTEECLYSGGNSFITSLLTGLAIFIESFSCYFGINKQDEVGSRLPIRDIFRRGWLCRLEGYFKERVPRPRIAHHRLRLSVASAWGPWCHRSLGQGVLPILAGQPGGGNTSF